MKRVILSEDHELRYGLFLLSGWFRDTEYKRFRDWLKNDVGTDNYSWPPPDIEDLGADGVKITRFIYFRNEEDITLLELKFGVKHEY